jgi:hypothetical protein
MAFAAARWEVLRSNVGEIGQLAASAVDGDLHRRLLDPTQYSDELYAAALYTMAERDGGTVFVLDTAASPDLRTKHQLRASAYMEPFEIREEYDDGWTKEVAAGKTYVTPSFQQDDFLIYAPDCDAQAAKDIAAAILRACRSREQRIMPACTGKPTRRCIRREPRAGTASSYSTRRWQSRRNPDPRRKSWSRRAASGLGLLAAGQLAQPPDREP